MAQFIYFETLRIYVIDNIQFTLTINIPFQQNRIRIRERKSVFVFVYSKELQTIDKKCAKNRRQFVFVYKINSEIQIHAW